MGKEKVNMDGELAPQIKANTDDSISKLAESQEPSTVMQARDITGEVLAPLLCEGPAMKPSQFFMYKGMLRKLSNYEETSAVAVLAGGQGDGDRIHDMITGNSIDEILGCPEVAMRWESRKAVIMGLAVLHAPATFNVHSTLTMLTSLKTPLNTLLVLVGKNGCRDIEAFEVDKTAPETEAFVAVNLQSVCENKKMGVNSFAGHFSLLGVTYQDKALSMAHNQLLKVITAADATEMEDLTEPQSSFVLNAVPADGSCFWRSIIHAIDFSAYPSIPRKESGYAVNARQVEQEELLAKKLMDSVLQQCDCSKGEDGILAKELSTSPQVSLSLVPLICDKLQIGVRITLSAEARLLDLQIFLDLDTVDR